MLTLWCYNLKIYLRDVKAWTVMLLAPVAIILLVSYGVAPSLESNLFVRPFTVAVVDQDDSFETRILVHHFTNTPAMEDLVTVKMTDYDQAMDLLEADEIAAAIIIPQGFVWNIERGRNLPITVIGSPHRPLQSSLIRQMMQSGADLVTAAQSGVITVLDYMAEAGASEAEMNRWYKRTVADFSFQSLGRNRMLSVSTVSATGEVSAGQYYAVALATVLSLFAGLAFLWPVREAERGLFLRYRAAGVSTWSISSARFLSMWVCQFIQLGAIFGLMLWILPWKVSEEPLLWLLMGLAMAGANAGVMLLVSSMAPTGRAANLLGLLAVLAFGLVGGAILPPAYLPGAVAEMGWLSPVHWGLQGAIGAVFTAEAGVVLQSAAVLGAGAAGSLALATGLLGRIAR